MSQKQLYSPSPHLRQQSRRMRRSEALQTPRVGPSCMQLVIRRELRGGVGANATRYHMRSEWSLIDECPAFLGGDFGPLNMEYAKLHDAGLSLFYEIADGCEFGVSGRR